MKNILTDAERLIYNDREAVYGHPFDNFTRTAALWSAYLGIQVTAEQVVYLNILQKVSRTASGVPQLDTVTDIAGFAGLIERIAERRKAQQALLEVALPKPSAIPEPTVIRGVSTRGVHIDPLSVMRDLDSSGPLQW